MCIAGYCLKYSFKQLKNLNQNEATGPDELPARFLKETAEQITLITLRHNSHTTQANSPSTGYPSPQKTLNQALLTTDPYHGHASFAKLRNTLL